jgi:hypothetical protein
MSISASLLIVLIVIFVTYVAWNYWKRPSDQKISELCDVVASSDKEVVQPTEFVGGFSTMTSSELPKLKESDAFGLTPNPKDKADVDSIEEKRKFINCNDEPKSFLPPKKLTNSYDHDDDEGTYVYDRCHMDTKAHIPKRDKSRSVYQSIAGDLDFPVEDRGKIETRVVSTLHENDGGYFNRRGNRIEESPPRPA